MDCSCLIVSKSHMHVYACVYRCIWMNEWWALADVWILFLSHVWMNKGMTDERVSRSTTKQTKAGYGPLFNKHESSVVCKNLIQKITLWSVVCNRQAEEEELKVWFSLSGWWWWWWLNIPILGSKNSPFPGSILIPKIWFCNKTRQYEATRCVWASNLLGPMKWFCVISTSFFQHPWMIFVADRTRQGKKQLHTQAKKALCLYG